MSADTHISRNTFKTVYIERGVLRRVKFVQNFESSISGESYEILFITVANEAFFFVRAKCVHKCKLRGKSMKQVIKTRITVVNNGNGGLYPRINIPKSMCSAEKKEVFLEELENGDIVIHFQKV